MSFHLESRPRLARRKRERKKSSCLPAMSWKGRRKRLKICFPPFPFGRALSSAKPVWFRREKRREKRSFPSFHSRMRKGKKKKRATVTVSSGWKNDPSSQQTTRKKKKRGAPITIYGRGEKRLPPFPLKRVRTRKERKPGKRKKREREGHFLDSAYILHRQKKGRVRRANLPFARAPRNLRDPKKKKGAP